jgi:hypothetical protein
MNLKALHGMMHTIHSAPYIAIAVNYTCKMLMKLTIGDYVIKLFFSISQISWSFRPWQVVSGLG